MGDCSKHARLPDLRRVESLISRGNFLPNRRAIVSQPPRRRDVIGEEAVAKLREALSEGDTPNVEVKRFEDSGHLAHLDEREDYVTVSHLRDSRRCWKCS